jgi:hypothetical protein
MGHGQGHAVPLISQPERREILIFPMALQLPPAIAKVFVL